MPRKVDKRKPATIIREQKRAIDGLMVESSRRWNEIGVYRARATKAETETAEWKRRFDALLAAIPELRKVQG